MKLLLTCAIHSSAEPHLEFGPTVRFAVETSPDEHLTVHLPRRSHVELTLNVPALTRCAESGSEVLGHFIGGELSKLFTKLAASLADDIRVEAAPTIVTPDQIAPLGADPSKE